MDNMVKTFVNEEFGSVRTIEENGKILFCVNFCMGVIQTMTNSKVPVPVSIEQAE